MNAEGLMENSGGRGLPEKLPAGERVLWQGSPDWKLLARRVFHIRLVAAYFAIIVAWCAVISVRSLLPVEAVAVSTAKLVGLSLVPMALMVLYCWGLQRSTIYTITSRRVVMSFGIALPMTINLPFSRIETVGFKRSEDGSGDLALRLIPGELVSYFIVWPHVRPWRMARTEPMLRCIPQADAAAAVLARGLAAQTAASLSLPTVSQARPIHPIPGLDGQAQAA